MISKVAKVGKVGKIIKHTFVMFVSQKCTYGFSQRVFTAVLSGDKKAIFTSKQRLPTSEYSLSREKKSVSKLPNITHKKGFFKACLRLPSIQPVHATKTPYDILKRGYLFSCQRVIHAIQATFKKERFCIDK